MTGEDNDIATSPLTEEDLVRYSRQILFPAFGEEGQRKLRKAHVLIAGGGGRAISCLDLPCLCGHRETDAGGFGCC
jgi:molybdopterin/thiamine biosynthesis adenylyltransferase